MTAKAEELQHIKEMADKYQSIANNLNDVRLHFGRNKGRARVAAMELPYKLRMALPEDVRLYLNI